MAKLKHKNLFLDGDRAEVYAALQEDYDRDTWVQVFWHAAFIVSAVGAAVIGKHSEWLWLFVGLYAVERKVSCFIDNSNRNWAMHVIDWIENNRRDAA